MDDDDLYTIWARVGEVIAEAKPESDISCLPKENYREEPRQMLHMHTFKFIAECNNKQSYKCKTNYF